MSGFIADGIQIGLFFLSSFIAKMTLSEARISMHQPKLSFHSVRYLRKYVIGRGLTYLDLDCLTKDERLSPNVLSFLGQLVLPSTKFPLFAGCFYDIDYSPVEVGFVCDWIVCDGVREYLDHVTMISY